MFSLGSPANALGIADPSSDLDTQYIHQITEYHIHNLPLVKSELRGPNATSHRIMSLRKYEELVYVQVHT